MSTAAFVTGYHVSVLIGAAVFAAGAVVAWLAIPARERERLSSA